MKSRVFFSHPEHWQAWQAWQAYENRRFFRHFSRAQCCFSVEIHMPIGA
jgi:hypothetical protein